MNKQEIIARIKRWPTWLAIIGQIVSMLTIIGIDQGQIAIWEGVAISMGELLTILGVLNNPTTPDKF